MQLVIDNNELLNNEYVKSEIMKCFVEVGSICDVKTGKYDANHAKRNGKYRFFTCAIEPMLTDTYSFNDEVLILPGNGANVGEVFHYKGKLEAYQRTYVLYNIKANPKYLFYCFKKYWIRQILKRQVGSATNYIKIDDILSFKIPFPPLPVQKKIAKILDAADVLRQKDKALIEKYNELTKSLFLDMFGDPVTNPKGWEKNEFDFFAKIDTKMVSDFNKYANYPHIGIANIEKGTGKLVNYKLVKDENLNSGKYLFTSEHIIYSKIRPNLNKVALPSFSGLSSADSYPILVDCSHSNKIFFAYILRSSLFIDFILKHSKRTNIPKANKAQMRAFISIAPPISLQNKFAERVKEIEKQKQQAELGFKKSKELFNSLLQKAFKGQLF